MLAYYLMMSLIPFLIFFLNLLSFTPLGQVEVIGDMMEFLPTDSAVILEPILLDLVRSRSGTLLSLSLFLALWSGSNAIMQLISVMNSAFNLDDMRSFFIKRGLSILYTVLLAGMILLVLVGPIFGDAILAGIFAIIGEQVWIAIIWGWIKRLLPLVTLILGFALMYRFAPGFPKGEGIRFKDAVIGAVVATAGWLAASFGFSYYVNNFGNYANTYGSLGGVIVLLLWLYLTAIMILLGAEVSASYVFIQQRIRDHAIAKSVHRFVKERVERVNYLP